MIRLLHFADLHLGVENYGRLDPETGLSTRLNDFLAAFDFVIDYALQEELDLVLFAGDAFKNRDPSPTHQREFAKRIRRLSEAGMPTFLLVGNHDLPNAAKRAHAIEIFGTLDIPNIVVADRPGYHRLPTRSGEVQVVALPWVTRSHLLAREEYYGLPVEEVNQRVESAVYRMMQKLADRVTDDVPAIMVAHGTVPGAAFGTERSVLLGHDLLIDPSLLKDPRFAYVALGHIHKHQVLHDQPPLVYSGSIERIDFGEANEDKGFVVAEIGEGPTRWEFIKTPARPMRQIVIDVRDTPTPMTLIEQTLKRVSVKDAVVKLIIKATADNEDHIDNRAIRKLLEEAIHVAAIVRDVERPHRLRLGSAQEIAEATPRDLLDRYFQARSIPRERRERLLTHADQIFASVNGHEEDDEA